MKALWGSPYQSLAVFFLLMQNNTGGSQHQELHLLGQTLSDCWLSPRAMSSQKMPSSQLALGTRHHQAPILLQDLTINGQKIWVEVKKPQPKSYQQMLQGTKHQHDISIHRKLPYIPFCMRVFQSLSLPTCLHNKLTHLKTCQLPLLSEVQQSPSRYY